MAAGTVPSAPAVGRGRLEASCERVVAGQRAICHGDLASSRDAELLTQHVGMSLGGSRGNAEAFTDFIVRAPGCDELDDLLLPLGDGWKRVSKSVVHSSRS